MGQYQPGQTLKGSDGQNYVVDATGTPRQQAAGGLPTGALPFPGAQMQSFPSLPQQRMQNQDINTGLAQQSGDRAGVELGYSGQRLGMEAARTKITTDTAAANGGVDTNASQDQAGGHAIMLINSMKHIQDATSKDPTVIKPSWGEYAVNKIGGDPAITGLVQSPQRQRVDSAFKSAVESAIWLSTGAAAPTDQVERILNSLQPLPGDKAEVVADKHDNFMAYIEQAKTRAGPANKKVQQALDALKLQGDAVYGVSPTATSDEKITDPTHEIIPNVQSADPNKIGSDQKVTTAIPPAMQQEHAQFVEDHKPGTLDLGQYIQFRHDLNKKYGLPEDAMGPGADKFVQAYNSGQRVTMQLPGETHAISGLEKSWADVAGSPGGVATMNAANAGAAGLPDLLTGRAGRQMHEAADEAHPVAALLGDAAGSVLPVVGLEQGLLKGLTKKGVEISTAKRVIADLAANGGFGAVRGYNSSEQENWLSHTITGLVAGLGGSAASRTANLGARGYLGKETQEGIDELVRPKPFTNNEGVTTELPGADLTTMQRAGLGQKEEFFQGLPLVSGQREDAVKSWSLQNSARVLARIGQKLPDGVKPGQDANQVVHSALNQQFEAIKPQITGRVDGHFDNAISALRQQAVAGASMAGESGAAKKEIWSHVENYIQQFRKGGQFDGQRYRELSSALDTLKDNINKKQTTLTGTAEQEMTHIIDRVLIQTRAMVARANPEVGKKLKDVEGAWAHMKRIEGSSKSPGAMANEGVGTPDDYLSSIKNQDHSVDKTETAQGKAFDQPAAQTARAVLGKRPASGASLRETGIGLYLAGKVAAPVGAMLYAPGVKRITQALVDGKLGRGADLTVDKVYKALTKKSAGTAGSDVTRAMVAQAIRNYGQRKLGGH